MSCIYSYNSDIQVVGGAQLTYVLERMDLCMQVLVVLILHPQIGRGGSGAVARARTDPPCSRMPAHATQPVFQLSEKKRIEGYKAITKFSM